MKQFLLAISLCLLATGAKAEMPACDGSGKQEACYLPVTIRTADRDPCLEQMEAAMRAMEPYLTDGIRIEANDPGYAEKIKERSPIFTQWLATKRECWRKP